jgi:hypothetical protein
MKSAQTLRESCHAIFTKFATSYCFIADIISAVDFDRTGDYLATGDKGGRIVLFERNATVSGRNIVVGFFTLGIILI